ncbi:hypothetical protein [Labedaea rhizosphaerae]|uniref:Uncharacterized protein n=1 Tax=Labedaea rhizosphaerae TaxID=598644 RepID=A0A4V3CZA2_LABRH|nr:hypothetical protein [Labedaea rhizosphaerae]TDP97188.1 hypothetical protein EV186_103149 [Labedaea rhizosphaerae]
MTHETRRRRAGFYFTAAILFMPVLLLACTAAVTPQYLAYLDSADGWKDVGLAVLVIVVLLLIGLGYALARRYWRKRSPAIPAQVGAAIGIVGGLVPTNMVAVTTDDSKIVLMGLVPLAVVGAVLPWWLARVGQRTLWEPIDDELIDSGDQVVVRARGNRGLTLSVDRFHVVLDRAGANGFHLFEDLGRVTSVTVTKSLNEERRDVTGSGDEITVPPGAAVRIRMTRGTWFVPVDDAEGVTRLITRRRDEAIAGQVGGEDEFADDEEAVFHARRNRRMTLTIDESSLVMAGRRPGETFYAYAEFDEFTSVEVITISADQRRDVTGEQDEVLVTAGEALRIEVEDGEWLFPIDEAQEIATLITTRVQRYRLEDEQVDDA